MPFRVLPCRPQGLFCATRDHGSRCREEPPCGGSPSSGLAPCHDFVVRRNPTDGNPPGFFAPPDAEARFAGHGSARKFGFPHTLAFPCSSMLAYGPILRYVPPDAEVRLPHSLAFPCYSVSAARPLPRPGGAQAEGASRRGGADRGVSLKVMRRSAAMNRASDCRPARLQWSRASAMPPSPAEERLNRAKPKRNVSVAFLSTTESAETHLRAARKGLRKGASRMSAANRSLQDVSTWRTDACQRGIRRSRSCCFQCPANAGFRAFRGLTP